MKFKSQKLLSIFIVFTVILSVCQVRILADEPKAASEKLAAFPGAEGGGMWTTGARASSRPQIYHVTTLEDYNAEDGEAAIHGSLRDAVSRSNRIIVFDVAGNIHLNERLNITGSNLTILGQTAPGDGICVTGYDTHISTGCSNIIMRYLRFRMGDENDVEDDSLGGRNTSDVIIDHCSVSWSVDECASFYDNTNFTMQWCIVSESLNNSVHAKGSHGYGGIWGGSNASFHHNLMAHHKSRNPRLPQGDFAGDDYDMSQQVDLSDLRNNVIYNWNGYTAYGGQAAMAANIINCYYKPGPSTGGNNKRFYELSSTGNGQTFPWSTDLYIDGNIMEGNFEITQNNAAGVTKDGSAQNYYVWTKDKEGTNSRNVNYNPISENPAAQNVHFKFEDEYPVTTESAGDAYEAVLNGAGASLSRDSLDARVIDDVRNGAGAHGDNGIIDTPSEAGGLPELFGVPEADSDGDGLPDRWEDLNGTNKNRNDAAGISTSGYTYIEEYANDLADGSYTRDETKPTATPAPTEDPLSRYTWEVVDGKTVTITGYNNVKGPNEVTVPGTIDGLPVTAIGERVFLGCGNIKTLVIPDSIKTIGQFAFVNCNNLNSVTLPGTLETLEQGAFQNCGNLREIDFPESLRSIGSNMFNRCSLTSVRVPAGVTEIQPSAFAGCMTMTEITVDEGNTVYSSDSGLLLSKDKKTLVTVPSGITGEFTVPDYVSAIRENAFKYSSLSEVNIHEGIASLEKTTFNTSSIKSIYLPLSLKEIKEGAFYWCAYLTDVYYSGNESDWSAVVIDKSHNEDFFAASMHFMGADETPAPATATPVATETPAPATPTPVATETPAPATATPVATETPAPATATPVVTETPIPTPVPDSAWFKTEPQLSGKTITAEIENSSGGGAWFIAAAYRDGMMIDFKIIPAPVGTTPVSAEFNADYTIDETVQVRFYLWDAETLKPYTDAVIGK